MESTRQRKFARQLQREMADILHKELSGLEKTLLSITHVKVTADLQIARFYLTSMPEKKLPEIVQFLNDNDGELRRLLARRIKNIVKMIPELQFYEDEVQKEAEHLEEVFSNLREERRKKYGAEDAGPSVNPDDYDDLDTSQ